MAAQQPEENKLELLDDEEEDVHHEVCSDSGDAVNPNNDDDNDNDNDNDNYNDNDNDNEEDNNKKNSSNNNSSKAARLPRWTRQEILVLIQGKKVAENRVRRGRTPSTSSSSSLEPKWSTVSSYCTSHGVLRGPIQCRKRWSNLAGDFKKIKDWESRLQDDSDSFWFMRNDLRRQRKLPGFFDRHVFDILDHKKELPLFDSGRTTPADDPLFSDLDASRPQHLPSPTPIPAPTPISAKQPFTPDTTPTGFDDEKQAASNPEIGSTSQGERKRKRLVMEDETEAASLLQVMEKNGRILSTQLEAHNVNLKMDREDRKEHAHSLVTVLNKLADALARIADKL